MINWVKDELGFLCNVKAKEWSFSTWMTIGKGARIVE